MTTMNDQYYFCEDVKLKMNMRKLWTDHTTFTRMFIVDLLGNLPSINYTTDRLFKNQEAIGNFNKLYFGDIAGDDLTNLLKEHITLTIDIFKAIKVGNMTNVTILETDAVTNVENIATFLNTINHCYSKDELTDLFKTYLILIKYQFIARMNGDYNADIIYYDMGLHHIFMISDYLTNGIIERLFEEEATKTVSDQELRPKQLAYQETTYQETSQHLQQGTSQPEEQ